MVDDARLAAARAAVRTALSKTGNPQVVARQLGIHRSTILAIASGMPVRPGTVALLAEKMAILQAICSTPEPRA